MDFDSRLGLKEQSSGNWIRSSPWVQGWGHLISWIRQEEATSNQSTMHLQQIPLYQCPHPFTPGSLHSQLPKGRVLLRNAGSPEDYVVLSVTNG